MTASRRLPDDIARCAGVGSDAEGWREGCEDCLRRICPPSNPERAVMMRPPPMVDGECQWWAGP